MSEPKSHFPLSAVTKPNTDPAQAQTLPASLDPTVKPGEYPFKRSQNDKKPGAFTIKTEQGSVLGILFICFYFHHSSSSSKDTQSQSEKKRELPSTCRSAFKGTSCSCLFLIIIISLNFSETFLYREITSLQIFYKIGILTQTGKVSFDFKISPKTCKNSV